MEKGKLPKSSSKTLKLNGRELRTSRAKGHKKEQLQEVSIPV
jgi:hypothetical protein